MRKSRRMQIERAKEIAAIAAERLTKPAFIRYTGLALWQIVLASSVGGLAAITILDALTSKEDDEYLQEYLEIVFPMDGFLSSIPVGLVDPRPKHNALFNLGMRFGEIAQPDLMNNTLITNHFVAEPVISFLNLDGSRPVKYTTKDQVSADMPWNRGRNQVVP